MNKIKIAVAGAGGRMGKRILSLAHDDPDFQIVGGFEPAQTEIIGVDIGTLIGRKPLGVKVTEDLDITIKNAQVLIDFTHPVVTQHVVETVPVNLVIGTTGLSQETQDAIKNASERIAIFQSPNMSAGANSLFELVSQAAKLLGSNYDIEITEAHHRMKIDAPSGTALKLAEIIAQVKGWDPKKDIECGRSKGKPGEREKGKIFIHALRGGDVVGEHTVFFVGDGETLELTHRATSRDAFARGALLAAKFVAQKKKGLYNMRHLLHP